ncbi:hypothetical protein RND71_004760 [Anisodus tanguticus]|uniref:TF-B3 domain-containing protein n=1 Tax=Anisodus tanguticus TaxID=243964 RepID=A0AAE1SMP4_9SOLA|nr:hypothetical protein RND71_004760 [Anisodus tanguticus]
MTVMKILPKKPHFFKPIQPGFEHGLKVPIGFLKYLKGHEHIEHAVLRRGGKKWLVKLNGQLFEEGWEKFAKDHDLQLGDMLVFRHEGNMEFEVSIFDSSHCDREYAEYLQEEGRVNNVEENSKKDKPNPNIMSTRKAFPKEESASHSSFSQSHFKCAVRLYFLSKGYLRLPKKFAMENGLVNKNCGLIIRDERQRSWNLRLVTHNSIVHVVGGWGEFHVANDLKEGDYMMFEVVANGEKPIWKFHENVLADESDLEDGDSKKDTVLAENYRQYIRGSPSQIVDMPSFLVSFAEHVYEVENRTAIITGISCPLEDTLRFRVSSTPFNNDSAC